jgi:hypothetical protein
MTSAFQTALATLDVIQATVLLAIWKEADDDRASHHFNRVSCSGRNRCWLSKTNNDDDRRL